MEARSDLARAHLQSGNFAAALAATAKVRELYYPTEEPTLRLLEGLALLEMDRIDEGVRAFDEASRAADALPALTERNVAALEARALALSGLAVATGDPIGGREAVEALTRARTITTAAGAPQAPNACSP